MPRIAEKLEFMNVKAITVCAKARIGRKVRRKNQVLVQIFNKVALKVESLDISRDILQGYRYRMDKSMSVNRVNGKSQL